MRGSISAHIEEPGLIRSPGGSRSVLADRSGDSPVITALVAVGSRAIGLDIEKFDDDVRVHPTKVLHRVQDDAQDAEVMDLNSTPTFFVNGKRHRGPWDSASLIRALEEGRT